MMNKSSYYFFLLLALLSIVISCKQDPQKQNNNTAVTINDSQINLTELELADTIIIDSELSFNDAIEGTRAPNEIIDQLTLFDVQYLSTDDKIHQGQILTNKKLEEEIINMFGFMLENKFVVEKAVPIVRYNWSDSLSMDDNNTYSFCYRNISYSKHATGMAIDINPRFNPLRWKKGNKPNEPNSAIQDTTINGTLYPDHIVVKEFRRLGFRWGHTFSKYYDDHHFEK